MSAPVAKTCLAITHVAFEDLGLFGPVLETAGFRIVYRRSGVDAVTETEFLAADLVVVLGGPIGAYETDQYPFLIDELALIRARLREDKPLLGICLGAQLMAAAAGARVYPGPAKEIGWGPVSITPAGADSALAPLNAPDARVLHWHGDTFDLPAGATRLASTEITPNQAFSLGRNALALQFHVEVNPAVIETWLIGHTCELGKVGIAPRGLREASRGISADPGLALLRLWLAGTGLLR